MPEGPIVTDRGTTHTSGKLCAHQCNQFGGSHLHVGNRAAVDVKEGSVQLLSGIGKGCTQSDASSATFCFSRLIIEMLEKQNGITIVNNGGHIRI